MTLFFYILIALITFLAFLHAWAKKDFDISRTVVINRPKEEVYNLVRQLKKEPLWMPWFAEDFNGVYKHKGEDGKLEAMLYWKGHKRFYVGTQKIVKLNQNKIVETRIMVVKPFKMIFLEYKGIKELDSNTTKMVWGVRGSLDFPFSVISLLQPVDKTYGGELEKGLRNLKTLLETKNEVIKNQVE